MAKGRMVTGHGWMLAGTKGKCRNEGCEPCAQLFVLPNMFAACQDCCDAICAVEVVRRDQRDKRGLLGPGIVRGPWEPCRHVDAGTDPDDGHVVAREHVNVLNETQSAIVVRIGVSAARVGKGLACEQREKWCNLFDA